MDSFMVIAGVQSSIHIIVGCAVRGICLLAVVAIAIPVLWHIMPSLIWK